MKKNTYKPGVHKLIHHQEHLAKVEKGEIVGPIHISIFPNTTCQLNCPYCSFGKTKRTKEELSLSDFCNAVDILVKYGLKALEFSGGGDPLLWSYFNLAVPYAYSKGLKLSLVTNGIALGDIPQDILKLFTWIRVSVRSAKYAEKMNMTWIPQNVKRSMSFIVDNQAAIDELKNLYAYAKETNTIIRVAPMRPATEEWELEVQNATESYGEPLLFFTKPRGAPLGCYMPWFRAAIDWHGNFLPCPSVEVSFENFGEIPEEFFICKIKNLEKWLQENPPHDMGHRCSFCNCGKDINDYVYLLLQETEDVDFV
jgi:MoaA/NifB/PqqE/SkfB family radical SAM enzyme